MLLTPSAEPADNIDRIMLLMMWVSYLSDKTEKEAQNFIVAGIGKPTLPINPIAVLTATRYWQNFFQRPSQTKNQVINNQLKANSAINYGDPQGDKQAREKIAAGFSHWYLTDIEAEHVLFTIGGAGAIHIISNFIKKNFPESKIITPVPHYGLYSSFFGQKNLLPIEVMNNSGYKFTAESLKKTLAKEAKQSINILLFCDPNNPLGTIIGKKELTEIAKILKNYSETIIVIDEAYAEMCFNGKHISLLTVAPDLQERIILIRSATKACSAAGERMAALLTANKHFMTKLIQENINICGHAPRSHQYIFAETINSLSATELNAINEYYEPQVAYMTKRLRDMGAAMPDPNYKVEATFYVMGDFSDLLGLKLPPETEKALNKTGLITTDEDIAYYLLFCDKIMLAPLSYFGLSDKKGYLRITCSSHDELQTLADRLEFRLKEARKIKQDEILRKLNLKLEELTPLTDEKYTIFYSDIDVLMQAKKDFPEVSALELKKTNHLLTELQLKIDAHLKSLPKSEEHVAAIKLQSYWRRFLAKKAYKKLLHERDQKWESFIDALIPSSTKLKTSLLSLSHEERVQFAPWKGYLSNNYAQKNNFNKEEKCIYKTLNFNYFT